MGNVLVVNSTSSETRVALVEDGIISEFHIERKRDRGIVGNIYKGRIQRVIPGMQAAFVDIGQERAGFLHASDVYDFEDDIAVLEDSEEGDIKLAKGRGKNHSPIQETLREGQEILVQVKKEPINTKGARLTSHIAVPGRYVVFMPTVSHVGISRKISGEKERSRLRRIVNDARPERTGFIVRTVSQGISEAKLRADMDMLIALWSEVLEKHNVEHGPCLINEEPPLTIRSVRDLVSGDIDMIILDDAEAFDEVVGFVEAYMPSFEGEISLYTDSEPIFDAYGIEPEIRNSMKREVPLPSGGSLVIDRTEALTAIDVNTGKFTGDSESHEDTIFKTNLEAADEVVYQLRLRNIGGIIIIDFIDMEEYSHRQQVYKQLERALEQDRVTSNALNISEFGLVEMTRKRTRESLSQFLSSECPMCHGTGAIKSIETVAYEVLRELKRRIIISNKTHINVKAHEAVIDFLKRKEKDAIQRMERSFERRIHLNVGSNLHIEEFEVRI